MIKFSRFAFLVVLLALLTLSPGCKGQGNGDTPWKYEQTIKAPIEATAGVKKASLGNIKTDKVKVDMPAKTLAKDAKITLATPKKVPKVVGKEVSPLGSPIEVTAGEDPVRLNQPVTITFAYDKALVEKNTDPGRIVVAYFSGDQWEYIKPDKIDQDNGTVTFTTYHFSFFGAAKVSTEEQLNQIIKSQTMTKVIQDNVDDVVDDTAEKVIDSMLGGLGLEEDSWKSKVLGSLLKDDEYKDMYDAYKSGDASGFNEKLNVLIGKKIAENVPDSVWKSALEGLTDDKGLEYVQAVSQAMGFLVEGQYKDAARIVGEAIADEFPLTLAIKVSAELMQYRIDMWKDQEIEAAFRAYKDGAEAHFWGYNVEKGDFDTVWTQMRGIGTRLMSEAIARENRIREEAGQPPLTDREMDNIRNKVKDDLKEQFESRADLEDELETEEAKMKKLIMGYKEAGLLSPGQFGYSSGMDTLDSRIEKLIHFKRKVLRDIGRGDITDGAFTTADNLSIGELIQLTQAWYTKDGYKKYADMVKKMFGIDIYPTAEQILGNWTGTLTIKDLNFPETPAPTEPSPSSGEGGLEGCDMSALGPAIAEAIKALVGKPLPMTLGLSGDKTGKGTATIMINAGDGGKPTTAQYTYSYGHLVMTVVSKDGNVKFDGTTEKLQSGGFVLNGTFSFGSATAGMSGSWSVSK